MAHQSRQSRWSLIPQPHAHGIYQPVLFSTPSQISPWGEQKQLFLSKIQFTALTQCWSDQTWQQKAVTYDNVKLLDASNTSMQWLITSSNMSNSSYLEVIHFVYGLFVRKVLPADIFRDWLDQPPVTSVYFGGMMANQSLCMPHFDVPSLRARIVMKGNLLRRTPNHGHLEEVNDSSNSDQPIQTQEDIYASEFTHQDGIIVV